MWQFFDCLVDGITVLEHGEEFFVNTVSGDAEFARDDRGWVPIVHFDLKPRNSKFIEIKNGLHTDIDFTSTVGEDVEACKYPYH